jgi:hypothetical protein
MDYIDRSMLGKYRDPARLARSQYVHCLLKRLWHRLHALTGSSGSMPRAAPCG